MKRWGWLLIPIAGTVIFGCKGKLPASLTRSKTTLPVTATSVTTTKLLPGSPAHDFVGEIIFGNNPMSGL